MSNKLLINILTPFLSIFISLILGGIFIALLDKDVFYIYSLLFSGTLGNLYGIGQVLFKATPLIFTGLAVLFAFKAGLFNIGVQGQLYIGALSISAAAFIFGYLPSVLLIPLSILAGFIGGALWGAIPGFLKAKFGSHEVINTIMMNFIALAIVSYVVNNIFMIPATVHTPEISQNAVIPRLDIMILGFKGSPVNLSILFALLLCAVIYYIFAKTLIGYEIKTTGANEHAAKYSGINIKKVIILSMAISGGIAGLSGMNFVLGYKHYFEIGFSETEGFIGIAVALIARNNPFAVILVAFFFGVLEYGGLTINTVVPKELVTILQAIIIISSITLQKLFSKYIPVKSVNNI